jgi:hypothetical protein
MAGLRRDVSNGWLTQDSFQVEVESEHCGFPQIFYADNKLLCLFKK